MRNLVPYRPGRMSIFDGLDQIFDTVFTTEPVWRTGAPAVDIREEDDGYQVQAELPGVAETDLKVSVDDNVLTISAKAGKNAERKTAERKTEGYLVRERRQATYTRSFVLPRDADHEAVSASFEDGLLTLSVPKTEASKARQIPVNTA